MDSLDEFLKNVSGLIDERIKQQEPSIYEIDVNKKYIFQFEEPLSMAELETIQDGYKRWITSDEPILVLFGKVKLVKAETADER